MSLTHNVSHLQLTAIKLKYEKLEEELREERLKTKSELAEFMEGSVLTEWTRIRNHRRKIETRMKYGSEV